jgi:hypothetical protein
VAGGREGVLQHRNHAVNTTVTMLSKNEAVKNEASFFKFYEETLNVSIRAKSEVASRSSAQK